jgi:quercetin dioxygenase-like cupin family protein
LPPASSSKKAVGRRLERNTREIPTYLVPPHSHPNAEAVWLISGNVVFGFGDKVDKTLAPLKPGAFFELEAGGKHWVWTGDEGGIIDVQVSDPFGMTYVNPADAPMKMK